MDNLENFSSNINPFPDIGTTQEIEPAYDAVLNVFRIIVCIVGLIGNLLVIFVILVLQEYKKAVTHWYVLQLALADSIFLLTLPFKVVEDYNDEWIFSGGMCKAKETILFLNYYSSILFLMVMSIDRYIAVCHGFSSISQKLRTKRSAYIITLVVWVLSLLLCIPITMYSDKRGIYGLSCKCQYAFPKSNQSLHDKCIEEGFNTNETLAECMEKQLEAQSRTGCTDLKGLGGGDFNFTHIWNVIGSGIGGNDTNISDLWPVDNGGSGQGNLSELPDLLDFDGISQSTTSGVMEINGDPPVIYEMGCSYAMNGRAWTSYLTFNFVVMFILPLIIMSACYCLIAFRLKQSRVRRSSVVNEGASNTSSAGGNPKKLERKRTRSAATTKAEKNRIRVTCTCLVLVLLFLICWLPFHSVHLAKMKGIAGKDAAYCAWIGAVSSLIAYVNSALNPYVYNFIGTRFGKRLRSAAGSVKTSVKKRTSSISSGGGAAVRYTNRKQSRGGNSISNGDTVMTNIYKGKSEMATFVDKTENDVFKDESPDVQEPLVSTK